MSGAGATLRLDLRPSWRLACLIVGLHGLAGASILVISIEPPALALAALLAALGGASAWDRALLRGRRSPRSLLVAGNGGLEVELAGGARHRAGTGPRTVSRFLVALPLAGHARRSMLVTADMLDPEGFRLLRLWALWGRLPGVASAQLPG